MTQRSFQYDSCEHWIADMTVKPTRSYSRRLMDEHAGHLLNCLVFIPYFQNVKKPYEL